MSLVCRIFIPRVTTARLTKVPLLVPATIRRMASTIVAESDITHDVDDNEFYIYLDKDKKNASNKAYLQYSYIRPKYVDLEHTVVPVQFRGHGIAKVLAQTAFDHFVQEKIDIRPTCTYLQKYYQENPLPQYKERVKWENSSI